MTRTTKEIEVTFVNDKEGWATTELDEEHKQIGYTRYNARKSFAITEARAMSGGVYPILVYTRSGEYEKTIYKANK